MIGRLDRSRQASDNLNSRSSWLAPPLSGSCWTWPTIASKAAPRAIAGLLLALALLQTSVMSQEPPTGKPAKPPVTEGGGSVENRIASAGPRWITGFLEEQQRLLADPNTRAAFQNQLRAHLGELDSWLFSEIPEITLRRRVRDGLHAAMGVAIGEALTSAGGGSEQAPELLSQSIKKNRLDREDYVLARILCWCPRDACNFTRSVAGCPDPCAAEQTNLVRAWIEEGCSDQEIFNRMVTHEKGGPKVLSLPEGSRDAGWFFLPFFLAALILVVCVGLLLRVVKKGATRAQEGTADAEVNDADWDARIERELKEMEN